MDPVATRLTELRKELERQDALARSLRDEVDTMETLRSAAEMEARNAESKPAPPPGVIMKKTQVPEDWMVELFQARDALARAKKDFQSARKEEQRLFEVVERDAAATQTMSEQLNNLFTAANWKPGAKKGYVCPIQLNDEVSAMKKKIIDLYEERGGLEIVTRRQTRHMETLAAEINELDHVESTYLATKADVKIKQMELQNVKDEINSLRRILKKKTLMLDKEEKKNEQLMIKAAEGSKRVAQVKVSSHDEQIRRNEVSVRNHAMQVRKLEEKLEIVGEAIRGDEADGADGGPIERVPATDLEDMRKELDRLATEQLENDKKLKVLDADHEELESRVRTLARARMVAERDADRIVNDHKRNMALLRQELDSQATETDAIIDAVERDVEVSRSRQASRSQSQAQSPAKGTGDKQE